MKVTRTVLERVRRRNPPILSNSAQYPEYGSANFVDDENITYFYDTSNILIGQVYVYNNTEYIPTTDSEWVDTYNEFNHVVNSSHMSLFGQDTFVINYNNSYGNFTFLTFDEGDYSVIIELNADSSYANDWLNSLVFKF